MRLEEIINTYIAPIEKFETVKSDFTGKDIFEHYRSQAKIEDIEPFTTLRFQAKFKNFIENREQYEFLTNKAKQVTLLAQEMFRRKFPRYYETTSTNNTQSSTENETS